MRIGAGRHSHRTRERCLDLRFTQRSGARTRMSRYWPVELDIHNSKIAALRENAGERWLRYLRSLPMRHLSTSTAAAASERLWTRLTEEIEAITPPNASPTDDGGVLMSWTRDAHIEIEVMPDGTYEWFYRHRATNTTRSGQVNDESLPDEFVLRLREVLG